MSPSESPPPASLTPDERAYIRRELDLFFSTLPRVADGFHLRTWRGGPQAGRPKVPLAAQGLLARGLVRLDASLRPPRLFFTEAGLAALRAMMADARLASPKAFAHVRQELGIDPGPGEEPVQRGKARVTGGAASPKRDPHVPPTGTAPAGEGKGETADGAL
ncbi:MAG: hypothetical protein JOY66_17650 [Acetobacteraceae bacterium]|nr:hypothetical protein [Acetobacteraceae bacterium]